MHVSATVRVTSAWAATADSDTTRGPSNGNRNNASRTLVRAILVIVVSISGIPDARATDDKALTASLPGFRVVDSRHTG